MKVDFTDNSKEVLAEFEAAVLRALEKCGLTAEGYVKKLSCCVAAPAVAAKRRAGVP